MAIYKSSHKGSQIDNAVSAVLFSKGKGNNGNPIYFDQYTRAQLATIDSVPMAGSERLISSGAAATALENVVGNDEIQTATTLGDSGLPASQRATKVYTDNQVATKQPKLIESQNISISESGEISVTEAVIKNGDTRVSEKFEHFGGITEGNNAEVIEEIEKAKHSTFDLSKFTVVGSPTITDDGIASGFSGSNYINAQPFSATSNTDFEIITSFKVSSFPSSGSKSIFRVATNNYMGSFGFSLKIDNLGRIGLSGAWSTDAFYSSLSANVFYTVKVKVNNGVASLYLNDTLLNSSAYTKNIASAYLTLGTGSATDYLEGSIGLKQFSITVDGVEVFNGNKTGIDTIKPDNYTVVGTPTISADGIVSGFSGSNGIFSELSIINHTTWDISFKFTSPFTLINGNKRIVKFLPNNSFMCCLDGSNLRVWFGNGSSWFIEGNIITSSITTNTEYNIKIKFTGNAYEVYINNILTSTITSTTQIPQSITNVYIGYDAGMTANYFTGSIDLNAFKIYVDGNLVYQPCLKIPYTWTSEGKKIVDSNYEDRVVDMYNQFGYSPYFVQKESSYLPATNEQEDIIYSYENGSTAYTQRANLHLEQRGTCIIGTAVTFPRAFADTNYALSIPYSAKTKTGFTPDITGDYVAEGLITLGN